MFTQTCMNVLHETRESLDVENSTRENQSFWPPFCHGARYMTYFYCLAVEAGFYSDVVECLPLDPAAQVRFPPPGIQLDWNSLRTKCPSSPNIVRTFGNFLGHFFRHSFYHHKPKMLSTLLIMKTGVVLLPFRMVGAAWLIGWLFF